MYSTSIPRRTRRRQMELRMESGNESSRRGDAETRRNARRNPSNGFSAFSSASRRLRVEKTRLRGLRGFTFVELIVVITIVVLLITMAIPIYTKSIIRTKEAVLKNNLFS